MTQKKQVKGLLCGVMVFLLMLMLPGATFAQGGEDGGMAVEVGGYSIHLIFLEPATTGVNPFHVQVFDEMGMPVNGAQVKVSSAPVLDAEEDHETMDAGAPEMNGKDEMNSVTPTPGPAPEHTGHTSGMGASGTGETSHTSTAEISSKPGEQHESHGGEQVEQAITLLAPSEEAGEYAGAITFPQTGHALLTVHLTINGASLAAQFPLEVAHSGSVYAILAGFLAMNVTIIGSAAILKRKNAPALSMSS